MVAEDEYAPALEMETVESGAESVPAGKGTPTAAATPEPVQIPAEAQDDPDRSEPRGQRVWNPKSRAMFRELAQKVKAGEVKVESDDLVPMEHEPAAPEAPAQPTPQPAAVPLVPATASPAAQLAAAIPAPIPHSAPAPDVGRAEVEQRKAQLDLRQRDLDAATKKLEDDRKALEAARAALPSSDKLVTNPVPTLAEYIKSAYGITDDAELKDTITDLMTEMSELYHGVQLPDEVKTRVRSNKALRAVNVTQRNIAQREAELQKRAEAQAKADQEAREKSEREDYERRAVGQLSTLFGDAAVQREYPYLAVHDTGPAVVWEVMKQALDQGQKLSWSDAAKLANDHYKAEHETTQTEAQKRASRLQSLLAPVATPAPAKPAASPGGASGPAPKQPAQAVTPPSPPAQPAPQLEDDHVYEDRHERRGRSARALLRKHGLGANNGT